MALTFSHPRPTSCSLEEKYLTSSESISTAGSSTWSVSSIWAINSANANSSRLRAGVVVSFVAVNINILARLYKPTKHLAWYFASIAIISPAESLARSLLSFSASAHFLTFWSTSNVDAAWRFLRLSVWSQKKQWFSDKHFGWLDLRLLTGLKCELSSADVFSSFSSLSVSSISSSFLFFARSSLVLLKRSLQDLCQEAFLSDRVCVIPCPSSKQLIFKKVGMIPCFWNSTRFLANEMYPAPASFLLETAGHCRGSPLLFWQMIHFSQSMRIRQKI